MIRLSYAPTVLLAGLLVLAGCGSSNTTATNTPPASTPPGNNPLPTTPPPTTPPPTTPPPTSQTPQYEAAMLRPCGPDCVGSIGGGQIIVNAGRTSGAGKVMATGGVPNASYNLTFFPFTNANASFPVGTISSDGSGNINGTFTFPQKGTFAGIFHMFAGQSEAQVDPMDSGVDDSTAGKIFSAPLVHASAVTPAISDGTSIGTDPLGSGLVTTANSKLHAELHGASSNTTYSIVECPLGGNVPGLPPCLPIDQPGTLTTDASGNATLDQNFVPPYHEPQEMVFEFFSNNQLQYVSGFTVK